MESHYYDGAGDITKSLLAGGIGARRETKHDEEKKEIQDVPASKTTEHFNVRGQQDTHHEPHPPSAIASPWNLVYPPPFTRYSLYPDAFSAPPTAFGTYFRNCASENLASRTESGLSGLKTARAAVPELASPSAAVQRARRPSHMRMVEQAETPGTLPDPSESEQAYARLRRYTRRDSRDSNRTTVSARNSRLVAANTTPHTGTRTWRDQKRGRRALPAETGFLYSQRRGAGTTGSRAQAG